MTPDDLIDEIITFVSPRQFIGQLHVMVDVAGRRTGIKGLRVDEESWTLFIETED